MSKRNPIEPWFAELYKLAHRGELSINELYDAFKREICKTENSVNGGKPPIIFYSHEWRWGEEFDGAYYRAKDVDEQLTALHEKLARAVDVIKKYENEYIPIELPESKKMIRDWAARDFLKSIETKGGV
jgi:hypothetical protein